MLMLMASSIFYLFYLCLEDCLVKTRNNQSLQHFHHLIILAVLVSKNVHFFAFRHIDHLTHIIYENKVVPVAAMCLPWSAKMWGEIFGERAVTSLATHITRHKGTDFQRPD